jgi:hypothetical protein
MAAYLIAVDIMAAGHIIERLSLGIIGPDYLSHRIAHEADESLGMERAEANAVAEQVTREVELGERCVTANLAEDLDAAIIVWSKPINGSTLQWRLDHPTLDELNPGECGFCGAEIMPGEQYGLGAAGNAHSNGHGCLRDETIPGSLPPERQRTAAERELAEV